MRRTLIAIMLFACTIVHAQSHGLYPPGTKWYHDPLGFRPVELSSAAGFAWGSTAVLACLILSKKDPAFRKKIYVYNELGAGVGYKSPYTLMFQNNTGLLYRIRDWMSVGAEMTMFNFSDDTNRTWTFGFRPLARWLPLRGERAAMFLEYGAGVSYSLDRFPASGTKFNFTTKYSIGAELKMSPVVHLQAGLRHSHVSNGNIKTVYRNPSHDSNGLFIGLLYKIW